MKARAPAPISDGVWILHVFDAPDRLGGLLAKLRFKQTRKNRANWWRLFDPKIADDKAAAEAARRELKQAGLASKWQQVARPSQVAPAPRPQPQAGNQITALQIAKENRLARDALKLAIERRKQAERVAQREVYRSAKDAVRRSKGEI